MLHQTFLFLGQLWQLFEVSQILEFLRLWLCSYLLSSCYGISNVRFVINQILGASKQLSFSCNTVILLSASETTTAEFANSADPVKPAHDELPHKELHGLPSCL